MILLGYSAGVQGQEDVVTISRKTLADLTEKANEVDRLRSEIVELKARLRGQEQRTDAAPSVLAPAPATAAPPAKPSTLSPVPIPGSNDPNQLPPLDPDSVVAMSDVLSHYSSNPSAADARYKGKRLKLRGTVAGFDKPMFLSYYHLVFRDPALSARALVRIYPPDYFKRVYVTATGEQIIGEAPGLAPAVLSKVGSDVLLEGRCSGVRNGVVSIVEASILSATGANPAR